MYNIFLFVCLIKILILIKSNMFDKKNIKEYAFNKFYLIKFKFFIFQVFIFSNINFNFQNFKFKFVINLFLNKVN